jgi:Xaa-Pro aminopeptidase
VPPKGGTIRYESKAGDLANEQELAMTDRVRRVPEPLYPTFPKDEYQERYKRTRAAMDSAGIDLLFLTEQENVVYYSGLQNAAWIVHGLVPGVILFPRQEQEPVMVLPDFWLGTAEKTTWLNDFVLHRNTHSDPDDFARLLVETIRERGWDRGRIGYEAGLEMIMRLPIRQFDSVRRELSTAAWVEAGDAIWQVRMIKSPREIDRIRQSAQLANRVQEQLREYAHPGMNELEIGRFIRTKLVEGGGSEANVIFLNMRAGKERYSMTDTLPQDRPIQNGEMLVVDTGVYLEGYPGDTARVMAIGEPSALYRSVYAKVIEAEKAALAQIRPGAKSSAAYQAVRQIYDAAGFPVHVDIVGHGLGLDIHEPPYLSAQNDYPLAENMVINIEPWITLPNDQGVLTIEDSFLVTKDGWEQLTLRNADELWVVH